MPKIIHSCTRGLIHFFIISKISIWNIDKKSCIFFKIVFDKLPNQKLILVRISLGENAVYNT